VKNRQLIAKKNDSVYPTGSNADRPSAA